MYILVVDKLVLRQKQINSMDTKYFEYFIVAILTTIIFFFLSLSHPEKSF